MCRKKYVFISQFTIKRALYRLISTLFIQDCSPSGTAKVSFTISSAVNKNHFTKLKKELTKWGEDSLGHVSNITPYLGRDQLSLSVNINILKSEVDEMNTAVSADAISSSLFSRLIDSPQYSDVSIKVIEEDVEKWESISGAGSDNPETVKVDDKIKQTIRTFYGHKNFLAANSPWFDIIFTNGMKESLENEITIRGVKHDIFYRLLKYCYTFKIDINGVHDAYEVLKAADRFQISNIRQECLRYLRQEVNEENIWDVWECAGKCSINDVLSFY